MNIFFLILLLVMLLVLGNIAYLVTQRKRKALDTYHDSIVQSFSSLDKPILVANENFALPTITNPLYREISQKFSSLVVGQDELATFFLLALLTDSHLLLEGVPGLAKTRSVHVFAHLIGLSFGRIQCTSDMMPADIIGSEIFNRLTNEFSIKRGSLTNHNIILADEINRTTPKVQSAMLELMQERQVTIAGETKKLPDPFLVFATQNSLDQAGTFVLPEAQRDRFFANVILDYPSFSDEVSLFHLNQSLQNIDPCCTIQDIVADKQSIDTIIVSDILQSYIISVISATRMHPHIITGASPRASLALYKGSQAMAFLSGVKSVDYVHIQSIFLPIVRHRVVRRDSELSLEQKDDILRDCFLSISLT